MVPNFDLIFFGYVWLILSSISLKRLQQWRRCFQCIEWMLKCSTGYSYGANQSVRPCHVPNHSISHSCQNSRRFSISNPSPNCNSKLVFCNCCIVGCWFSLSDCLMVMSKFLNFSVFHNLDGGLNVLKPPRSSKHLQVKHLASSHQVPYLLTLLRLTFPSYLHTILIHHAHPFSIMLCQGPPRTHWITSMYYLYVFPGTLWSHECNVYQLFINY